MRTIYIDCEGVDSVGEVWQRYVDAAKPAGAADFGRNLDAFWDAVEYGGPGCPGRSKLVCSNSSGLAALRVGSGLFILEVLRWLANEVTQIPIELA